MNHLINFFRKYSLTCSCIFFLGILFSCRKIQYAKIAPPPYPENYNLPSNQEALPAYDSSNYGIYKGVIINSGGGTATIKINLYNNSNQPYALLYENSQVTDSMIRYQEDSALGNIQNPLIPEKAVIPQNDSFYYTFFTSYLPNGGIYVVPFSVRAYGLEAAMYPTYGGFYCLAAMLKETSVKQVFCYEGIYTGIDSGKISFVVTSDTILAIKASTKDPEFFPLFSAPVTNKTFTLYQYDDVAGITTAFIGSVQGDSCTGTWYRGDDPNTIYTFSARRTL
jgi:hypothetical protein